MNIELTPELKYALELRHSKVRDSYERDRIKAVLLHTKGWTIIMIAQALLVHESTISRHLNSFITIFLSTNSLKACLINLMKKNKTNLLKITSY